MSLRLALELERDRYRPGDVVRGTVRVLEGGRSRNLSVLLRYIEATEDYAEVGSTVAADPLHEGDLTTGASFAFAVGLPPDALPNYRSAYGELYWDVSVKSDEFGHDTWESRRIDVP